MRGESLTLTAYHGALADCQHVPDADRWRWWTTDRRHAAYFGDVTERTLTLAAPYHLDCARFARRFEGGGYEADERLYRMARRMFRRGHDALVIAGWEGQGLVLLLREAA